MAHSLFPPATRHVLRELFVGLDDGEPVWITDGGFENSLLGTLDGLDARQASVDPRGDGTTIAGVAAHILFTLQFGNSYLRGERPDMDWEDSWGVQTVNADEWMALQDELRAEYETTLRLIEAIPHWDNEMLVTGTLALLPHCAYHFGAIRQLRNQL